MKDNYHFEVKRKRPEELFNKVSDYFKGEILKNYARSKSMMQIQENITIRSLELLDLKIKSGLILDAGCGPGFTSTYLKEIGYNVVALDIITEFLTFYKIRELNPLVADMSFLPFQPNTFDAIISISALQWIYRDLKNESMEYKLNNLAICVNNVLKPNSKAIFQFYPKSNLIMESIGKLFTLNTDLIGNFIIDNPNNAKKRTIFLLLKKRE